MKREEFNACIGKGMRGRQLGKEERRLEFCILAKTCSGTVKDREEAIAICSLPKEPKETKPKGKSKKCGKEMADLASCAAPTLDVAAQALTEALQQCSCGKVSKKTKAEKAVAEMPPEQMEAMAIMAQLHADMRSDMPKES